MSSHTSETEVRVIYVGLHPETALWIHDAPFRVVAVAKLDYFTGWTINPTDLLFRIVYFAQQHAWPSILKTCLTLLWRVFSPTHTKLYRKYKPWLKFIVANDVSIIDVENIEAFQSFCADNAIELVIINSWSILPQSMCTSLRYGCVNIHPSKLPFHKGAVPTLCILKERMTESAVTFLVVSTEIDGGGILAQHPYSIKPLDTSLDVERTIDLIIHKHLHADLVKYVTGSITLTEQHGEGSWTPKYQAYRRVYWVRENALDIANKIWLYPYIEPRVYCFSKIGNHTVYLKSTEPPTPSITGARPGFYRIRGLRLYVQTCDGVLTFRLGIDISICDSITLLCTGLQGTFSDAYDTI